MINQEISMMSLQLICQNTQLILSVIEIIL